MKTTLDLPDDLLIEAKAMAARRRTTLRDLVARGLRREIGCGEGSAIPPEDSRYELSELGLPRLKARGELVTDELISRLQEKADEEEFRAALEAGKP